MSGPSALSKVYEVMQDPFAGLADLTDGERTMLRLQSRGYSYAEIADALDTTPSYVGVKLARIRLKAKMDRGQAIQYAYRQIEREVLAGLAEDSPSSTIPGG